MMATDYMYGDRDRMDRGIWSDMGRWSGEKRPTSFYDNYYTSGYDRPMGMTQVPGRTIGGSYFDNRLPTSYYDTRGGFGKYGYSDWDKPITKVSTTGWHPAGMHPALMSGAMPPTMMGTGDQYMGRPWTEETDWNTMFGGYGTNLPYSDWDRSGTMMSPYRNTSYERYLGADRCPVGGGAMNRGLHPSMMSGGMPGTMAMGGMGMMGAPMMGAPMMGGPTMMGGKMWRPRCDIVDGQQFLTVEFELPGVAKESINLSVGDCFLIVQSAQDFKTMDRTGPLFQNERHLGQFYRRVELPFNVDTEKCQASLEHGILKIMLPKKNLSTTGIMGGTSVASPITTSTITSAGTPSSTSYTTTSYSST
jgi:HSP20 family molecular chaperone IbpA